MSVQTNTSKRQSNLSLFAQDLLIGGGSLAISRTIVAPLERIKIVLQTQKAFLIPEPDKYKGFMDAVVRIPQTQGVLSLWRGNSTHLFKIIPNTIAKFVCYDYIKRSIYSNATSVKQDYLFNRKFIRFCQQGNIGLFYQIEAALIAGFFSTTLSYPWDMVHTRLAADPSPKDQKRYYKDGWKGFRRIRIGEGIRTIYNGYLIALFSTVPYVAISFTAYDLLKSALVSNSGEKVSSTPDVLRWLGVGSIAGVIAQVACYPLDTVKRRLQVQGDIRTEALYTGAIDCMRKIASKEGFSAFYLGFAPSLLKVIPAAGIQFTTYDYLKSRFVVDGRIKWDY